MYAKTLCDVLARQCGSGDLSRASPDDATTRFDSLRHYRLLPAGKERRNQRLSNEEISSAILGFVTPNPKWAGALSIALGSLRPVGGTEASFFGVPSLREAIALALEDATARESLVRLAVSGAERFTNSHGSATITYDIEGARRHAHFVSKMAVSLGGRGAEANYDSAKLHSPFSREVSFNRDFFSDLAQAVELSRALNDPPPEEGTEYDEEERKAARNKRLGIRPSSRFLNIGVDNHATWPREETVVHFAEYKLVLMPRDRDTAQSLHVDLTTNRLDDAEALTVINRYLSLLVWADDAYAITQTGWSGNPVPVGVPKHELASMQGLARSFKTLPDARAMRALALYREARNAEQNFMISYAVLNYYKIIEIGGHHKEKIRSWFRDNYEALKGTPINRELFDRFEVFSGQAKPADYIHQSCRLAVAHANKYSTSDPDDAHELRRLHVAADVMRLFARRFIENELGVPARPGTIHN